MLISVVTPCFNLAKYLDATYRGLKSQTIDDWEWIIVDDGSTDGTVSIIDSFNDSRIVLLRSNHTGNLSILRNLAVKHAKGRFIAFVDGDDICDPTKFERQVDLFDRRPDVSWSHTNVKLLLEISDEVVDATNRPVDSEFIRAEEAFRQLLKRNEVYISTVMVRRSVLMAVGGFEESFNRCEDIELWLRLSGHGYHMGYLSQPLLHYRVRTTGLYTSKTIEYLRMNFVVYEKIRSTFPDLYDRNKDHAAAYLSNNHLKIAIFSIVQGKPGYRTHFRRALILDWSIKKLSWLVLSCIAPFVLRRYLILR